MGGSCSLLAKHASKSCVEVKPEGKTQYNTNRHEEGEEEYKPGHYHPVEINELYNSRFRIISKLGWGHFSTVWMARDEKFGCHVALKVLKAKERKWAPDEIKILEATNAGALNQSEPSAGIVKLIDHFEHTGPNGLHTVFVLELLGPDSMSLVEKHYTRGLPVSVVRHITHGICTAFDFLHRQNIIHTDFKPENVALRYEFTGHADATEGQGSGADWTRGKRWWRNWSGEKPLHDVRSSDVVVVDMGNAVFRDAIFTDDIQTTQYRAPEVITRAGYHTAADMWSVGCTIFELLTGDVLFKPPRRSKGDVVPRDEVHLAQMAELLGVFPKHLALKGRNAKKSFDMTTGKLLRIGSNLKFWPLQSVLVEKYNMREEDAEQVAAFLTPLFDYDQGKRATAADCLNHPWLADLIT